MLLSPDLALDLWSQPAVWVKALLLPQSPSVRLSGFPAYCGVHSWHGKAGLQENRGKTAAEWKQELGSQQALLPSGSAGWIVHRVMDWKWNPSQLRCLLHEDGTGSGTCACQGEGKRLGTGPRSFPGARVLITQYLKSRSPCEKHMERWVSALLLAAWSARVGLKQFLFGWRFVKA